MQHSNSYIIGFAVILTVVLGGLLALASTALKERQTIAVELDTRKQILGAVMEVEEGADIMELYKERITSKVVNRNGDEIEPKDADGKTIEPEKINIAKEYRKDPAERHFPVFIYEDKNGKSYILPVYGNGLWDRIWGYVALESDMNTIRGIAFGHKAETPGLGARISDDEVQNRFRGKKIFSEQNELVSVAMQKGEGRSYDSPHKVDGLSGATITAVGVNEMLENYFEYYSNYFGKKRKDSQALVQ
ncbi:MAG: NADH:ubiquinone reductase (Na(+)-transporting) subunit C [Bernardetiaceae bacterium]|nr:NADH:ubiquinone reductase (Na(+)-transporting) subunit C [Bernardetiaceae bacterium]